MKYQAIIFDFDYTLGDCTEGIVESVNYGLHKMEQKEAELPKIRKAVGMTLEDTYSFMTGSDVEEERALFANYFMEKADEVMVDCSRFMPFARETLEMLYVKKVPVGIVTTKRANQIEGIMKLHGTKPLVKYICGSDSVKVEKPDPEGLLKMVEEMKLTPKDVLYVGDSMIDAQTAQNAGIDFGGVTTGATTLEELESYPHVILMNDLRPILTMI